MQDVRSAEASNRVAQVIFLVCAVLIILVIVGIFGFLGANAFRLFYEPGGTSIPYFFTAANWDPTGNNGDPRFGAGGLILGSLVITIISVIITIPLALGMSLFLTELAPRSLAAFLQPLIELFTGMPSVIIGFLGLTVLVPFLQKVSAPITGDSPTGGYGWGAAIIVLVVMILPTVISITVDTLRAVPNSVREASLALGSSKWQMMSRAIIPAATTGIATAVVLGLGRAIGETLAVSLVLFGSSLPDNVFSLQAFFTPNINITQFIVNDFGETYGVSRDGYWSLAFLLLVISFLLICVSRYFASRSVYK
jgi:phosphate transport system permease protein